MRGRRAVWCPVALAGAALLLLACAPAAPVSQAPGTDATFTKPYIEPRPTPTPPACAQGQAPPGHPLTWTFEERLRCFPPFDSSPTPRPDLSRSLIPTPDPSKIYRPPDVREIVLKGQRVPLPEGVHVVGPFGGVCLPGTWCPTVITFYKGPGPLTEETPRVQIAVDNWDDPIVALEKMDLADPTAFDFLKPYVRRAQHVLGAYTPEESPTTTPP